MKFYAPEVARSYLNYLQRVLGVKAAMINAREKTPVKICNLQGEDFTIRPWQKLLIVNLVQDFELVSDQEKLLLEKLVAAFPLSQTAHGAIALQSQVEALIEEIARHSVALLLLEDHPDSTHAGAFSHISHFTRAYSARVMLQNPSCKKEVWHQMQILAKSLAPNHS